LCLRVNAFAAWLFFRRVSSKREGGGGGEGGCSDERRLAAKQSISPLSSSTPYITDPPFSPDTMTCVIYQTGPCQGPCICLCVCVCCGACTNVCVCVYKHTCVRVSVCRTVFLCVSRVHPLRVRKGGREDGVKSQRETDGKMEGITGVE